MGVRVVSGMREVMELDRVRMLPRAMWECWRRRSDIRFMGERFSGFCYFELYLFLKIKKSLTEI